MGNAYLRGNRGRHLGRVVYGLTPTVEELQWRVGRGATCVVAEAKVAEHRMTCAGEGVGGGGRRDQAAQLAYERAVVPWVPAVAACGTHCNGYLSGIVVPNLAGSGTRQIGTRQIGMPCWDRPGARQLGPHAPKNWGRTPPTSTNSAWILGDTKTLRRRLL